jgi:flagellar biosynthetic protein FlhB
MADQTEDRDSQTEEPTERKLQKAREKGDVPSSREPGNMMVALSLFLLATLIFPLVGPDLVEAFAQVIAMAGTTHIGFADTGLRDTGAVTRGLILTTATILVPVFGVMIALALLGVLIQGEVVISAERIKPKLSKLSPIAGFKRLFSKDTLVEFAKNLAKIAVVSSIGIVVTKAAVTALWQGTGFVPAELPALLAREVGKVFLWASALLVPLAIVDILWKRHQWREKQRMTVKELRDELKDTHGDPQIRRRRDQLRRQRATRSIAKMVPEATVVLTNPTHLAVALRYQAGKDAAPVCVAKGADQMAHQIRKFARQAEVPVIENKPLARALYAAIEVNQQIPGEHWRAVAEIVRYVMELERNPRARPPAGSTPRED